MLWAAASHSGNGRDTNPMRHSKTKQGLSDAAFTEPLLLDTGRLQAGTGCPANHAAGDFRAGIAGWLGCEVIRMVVDDDCFSNDLIDRETIGQKQGEGKSVIPEQRRQVSGVILPPQSVPSWMWNPKIRSRQG